MNYYLTSPPIRRIKSNMKKLWCYLFHNYIRLPNDNWTALVCQKCGLEYPIDTLLNNDNK